MPAYSAFLPRLLCLQIRDRNFRSGGAFRARALRTARKRGCVSEFFTLRRLAVSAGDIEGGGRGHEHTCADREHVAFVRASAQGIGRVAVVNQGAAVSSPPSQTAIATHT